MVIDLIDATSWGLPRGTIYRCTMLMGTDYTTWMLCAKHPRTRLHYLRLQHFGLLPSALIPVRRRQVAHAGQRGGMLCAKGRQILSEEHPDTISTMNNLANTLVAQGYVES